MATSREDRILKWCDKNASKLLMRAFKKDNGTVVPVFSGDSKTPEMVILFSDEVFDERFGVMPHAKRVLRSIIEEGDKIWERTLDADIKELESIFNLDTDEGKIKGIEHMVNKYLGDHDPEIVEAVKAQMISEWEEMKDAR